MGKYIFVIPLLMLVGNNLGLALQPVDVTDMAIKLSGREERSFEYKFATGDTIVLNASAAEGNDISEIVVREWPNTIRFQASDVEIVEEKRIVVSRSNVYTFIVKNKAVFKTQTYYLQIKRIPLNEEYIFFNTSAEWDTVYDTTYTAVIESVLVKIDTIVDEIVRTEQKLGSRLTGNTQAYLTITLPKGTSYWAYWLGVGQEAAAGLQQMGECLPEGASLLGLTNPVALFAVGLLPQLFSMSQGHDIYYYFIGDTKNLQQFMAGQSLYAIKWGKVITDYAKMQQPISGTFYLGLSNSHSDLTSKVVNINIVAVKLIHHYDYHEIQKPVVNKRVVPNL